MDLQATNIDAWQSEKVEISTDELDKAVQLRQELWAEHDRLKKISTEAYHKAEEQDAVVMELLDKAQKSKYFIDGMGTVYVQNKYQVKVPKETIDKEKLFHYIFEKYGHESLLGYQTINHMSLNSFYNAEKDIVKDAAFRLPGIPDVEHVRILGFRKS